MSRIDKYFPSSKPVLCPREGRRIEGGLSGALRFTTELLEGGCVLIRPLAWAGPHEPSKDDWRVWSGEAA